MLEKIEINSIIFEEPALLEQISLTFQLTILEVHLFVKQPVLQKATKIWSIAWFIAEKDLFKGVSREAPGSAVLASDRIRWQAKPKS